MAPKHRFRVESNQWPETRSWPWPLTWVIIIPIWCPCMKTTYSLKILRSLTILVQSESIVHCRITYETDRSCWRHCRHILFPNAWIRVRSFRLIYKATCQANYPDVSTCSVSTWYMSPAKPRPLLSPPCLPTGQYLRKETICPTEPIILDKCARSLLSQYNRSCNHTSCLSCKRLLLLVGNKWLAKHLREEQRIQKISWERLSWHQLLIWLVWVVERGEGCDTCGSRKRKTQADSCAGAP
jgi:hypothetical protein